MRIIVIGFGTVGQAFTKIIHEKEVELARNFGLKPKIIAVVDRGGAAVSQSGLSFSQLINEKRSRGTVASEPTWGRSKGSGMEIIEDVEADVVIEATPTNVSDGEPGLSNIKTALKRKKHVITTNKGPLALALPALIELARYNKVYLRFSGTVGGGTPLLNLGKRCLLGDRIISIKGILNGTTNYILTRMSEARVPMKTALQEAQKAGYAEADPSYDIKGIDSACKLVIMANWLMDRNITIKDVNVSGISEVSLFDLEKAEAKGCVLKLLATVDEEGTSVKPQLLNKKLPLCVGGTLNAVTFKMEYAGEVTIVGCGAGGAETASAVLRDLIDIKKELKT